MLRHPVQGNGLYPNCNDVISWIEEDYCYTIIGTKGTQTPESRYSRSGDSMHLLKSKDIQKWDYIQQLYKSKREWTSDLEYCSCPDFLSFDLNGSSYTFVTKKMMMGIDII